MVDELNSLAPSEKERVLRATALVSVYAAFLDGTFYEREMEEAKNLAHLRTYSSPLILRAYYKEVEENFEAYCGEIKLNLPPEKEKRMEYLEYELNELNNTIKKLDEDYAFLLAKSLNSYANLVVNSKKNFLSDFLLPLRIKGLTETTIDLL